MLKKIAKFINLQRPILITGETGTGKSKLALSIFEKSLINKENFLTVHLASLKEDLIESELFGHRRGSFTGALENKNGYFKDAGSGTLFIDEVGELSLEAQKKLLYILEEKVFCPVGDTRPIECKARLIFATNKDLKKMVKDKTFREDLYFRLMIFNIHLPSLKHQKELIMEEVQIQLINQQKNFNKKDLELSLELKMFLFDYEWPGNYRELKNTVEYLVAMSSSKIIGLNDLPENLSKKGLSEHESPIKIEDYRYDLKYTEAIENFEAQYLKAMLLQYEGRVNETARSIEISKAALIYKCRKYGINSALMRANKLQELFELTG